MAEAGAAARWCRSPWPRRLLVEQVFGHEKVAAHHLVRYWGGLWDPTGVLRNALQEGPIISLLSSSSLGQARAPPLVPQSCSWCARPSTPCWGVPSSGCPRVVPKRVSHFCCSPRAKSCVEFEHQDYGAG